MFAIIYPAALLLSTGAPAAPEFAPSPRQAFEGFVAINPPRADVPVGALWIAGYGPTGDAASKDNLETVRSLSSMTIDKNLQLSLSLGILDLLGVDPKARDHYTAHFSDLSIVRVKDLSRLPGLKGEPRIFEALKAGTVTVSTDSEVGIGAQTIGPQWHVSGSTANDRTRSYAIEARDMFIAIHVATPELTRGKDEELRISEDGLSARLDDFLIVISKLECTSASAICRPGFGVAKINTQMAPTVERTPMPGDGELKLPLPIPVSDEHGGLFDSLVLRWIPPCTERKQDGCRSRPRLFARYEGTRLADLKSLEPDRW